MGNHRRWIAKVGIALMFGGVYINGDSVQAEPVTNRILSHFELATRGSCAILKINFNIRIRYISHFPIGSGDQLNINVQAIDVLEAAKESITARESLRPPSNNAAAIQAIVFEVTAGQGTILSLQFTKAMKFNVAPGKDFQSILVALTDEKFSKADGKSGRTCVPQDVFRNSHWETVVSTGDRQTVATRREVPQRETVVAKSEAPEPPAAEGPLSGWVTESEAMPRFARRVEGGGGFREARLAMKRGDLDRAIKILASTDGPEALELLGVAYQKKKQMVQARAVYEEYLRRYADTPAAEGVRMRLAGIETANAEPIKLRKSGNRDSGRNGAGQTGRDRSFWTVNGSLSEFYIRDDSFRVVRDPTQVANPNDEDAQVRRNVLLSSADLFAAWGNSAYKSKFRFSGTEDHSFEEGEGDFVSVAALYLDTTFKEWDLNTQIGRQTHNGDGVLGRFDGVSVSWRGAPGMRVSFVGGSPVERREDEPYKDEKFFYGAAVSFGPILGGFDASLFAIEERQGSNINRRAIGTELRYADAKKSAFVTVDYDIFFNELNALIFNGSWTLPDNSVIRAAADYRKSPFLSLENALQGQLFGTIDEFLQVNPLGDVKQAALDRTATFKSASIGYTRQLTEKLQLNADVTAVQFDGTVASFGVDAAASTGPEYFYSLQFIGNELYTKGDLWTAGLRFADLDATNSYALDLSTRYLYSDDWRITPRVLLSYQEGKTTDLVEYSVLPSLLLDYFWAKDLNLELELGTRLSLRTENAIETRDTELFLTAGFRYDFNASSDELK